MSTGPNNPTPQPNPAAAFQALLEKNNNDGIRLASTLFDENFQLREKNRELRSLAPAEGSLVLSAEDAKKYQAYIALGIDAAEIKKKIDLVEVLEQKNKELSSMEALREVADIGLDGSKLKLSVLKDQLGRFPDAQISFKTEKDAEGKEAKVAYIKPSDKESETSFTDFAKANLADYIPALKVNAESDPAVPGNGPGPKPQGGSTNVFEGIRAAAKAAAEKQGQTPDLDSAFGRAA